MKISWERVLRDKESLGPIPWLTSYAYSSARAFAEAGVPLLLVGDSASMVVHGHRSTAPISEETMIDHVRAVRRGAPESFVVGDMPMGTYEVSKSSAMKSVIRFLKQGGADAVKLEGAGLHVQKVVSHAADLGILVFGHIGLTPQLAPSRSGYKARGLVPAEAEKMMLEARLLESAGACAILLESVPSNVSLEVKREVSVPIFGIGAGPNLDGQLLVSADLLGEYPDFRPSFATNFIPQALLEMNLPTSDTTSRDIGLYQLMIEAAKIFIRQVRTNRWPARINE